MSKGKIIWGLVGLAVTLFSGFQLGRQTAPEPKLGQPIYIKGENIAIPDSVAINYWKGQYAKTLAELESERAKMPPVPEDCQALAAWYERQVDTLESLLGRTQDTLEACLATSSGERSFSDTIDGWLWLQGRVPYPTGTITLTPTWLQKPQPKQERALLGYSQPFWDWPTIRALVRVKGGWWIGPGLSPRIENGEWLTRWSAEVQSSFLKL